MLILMQRLIVSPFDIIYPSEALEEGTKQTIRLDIQIKRHDGGSVKKSVSMAFVIPLNRIAECH